MKYEPWDARQALVFGMPKCWQSILAMLLSSAFAGHTAFAQHEHSSSEFEVFVAAKTLAGSARPQQRDNDDSWFDADVILGLTHDQFRVFGEYFITSGEHDLERFQVGYEVVPDTVLWLGRFHQPASAWNTEHHHGRYLQTAITRPSIENWEDDVGVIPQHITGALIESRRQFGANAGIQISGGVGAGPALSRDGFEPITLVGSNAGEHGLSFTGRLAYLPDYVGTSSAGLLFGHDQIFVRNSAALATLRSDHALLGIYGAYADWSVAQWRLIATGYHVDVELDRPTPDESFVSGYLQIERQLPHQLTAFARFEDSARMQNSHYVALFDQPDGTLDISLRRQALGLRWDFARRQAFSSEFARLVSLTQHERAYEMRLQWSAAIP